VIICGHYEGVDERVLHSNCEVPLGDFVLTGGEIPALAIINGVVAATGNRRQTESLKAESFEAGLLDYPQYTRPAEFRGGRCRISSGNPQRLPGGGMSSRYKEHAIAAPTY